MNITACEKSHFSIESLPFMEAYYNQTVVIKYGGNAMLNEDLRKTIIQDIILMKYVGMNPVVVHGGGPEITDLMRTFGKKSQFIDGLRVTDKETMKIVEMALLGKVNPEIVSCINHNGARSIGISGKDGNMIRAKQKDPNLGLVGEIDFIDTHLFETITQNGYIPVIAPIGVGENGESYNINADEVAGNLAAALNAKKLVLITDVQGVMRNSEDPTSIISRIKTCEIMDYIHSGIIKGGMIPKMQCCLEAVSKGVERAHIIDGRQTRSILLKIFTEEEIGTMITN